MDLDAILEHIGEFGRYQRTNYLLICLPVMFAAGHSLSYVFTAGIPTYRCFIPECETVDSTELYPSWLMYAVPGKIENNGEFTPKPCQRYLSNDSMAFNTSQACPKDGFSLFKTESCNSWIYDPFEHTIVQDWELTCQENAWKLALVGTMHFAGLVVGTALSGYFADRFGRKIIFILCTLFMAVTGIAQGFAWDYNSFLVFAFLNAVGTSGVYPLAFIIGIEMVGPRMRETSSIVLNYFYAVGEALVGLTAWALHDWRWIQQALSIPPLFFIAYFWLVPESVRWLLVRNEKEKAKVIIQRAARVNKKEISTVLLNSFDHELVPAQDQNKEIVVSCFKNEIWSSVQQILKSKTLMFRYTIMLYIWAVNAVVFYGLSLNSTNLSGNKYLNFALVCLVEIPGYSISWVCLRKLGRRLALSGSLLLCGVTCVAGGYITKGSNWSVIILFLLGKCSVTSSFAVIYTYTSEMMPTVVRSGGVGVMSTFARFGAMVAPFVPLLGTYYEALPLLIFGSIAFTGGLLALLLPETFRQKLPDTVQEAKDLGKIKNINMADAEMNNENRQIAMAEVGQYDMTASEPIPG